MEGSSNYKKTFHANDLQSFPSLDYFSLEKHTDLSSLKDLPTYEYKRYLLNGDNKYEIDDKETLEEASQRLFFYHHHDQNIYSLYKLTMTYLTGINDIFYTRKNVHLNCLIMVLSGNDCAIGCYHEGELVAHKRFHRYIVRGGGKSQIRHDDENGGKTKGSAGTNLRRYNAKEMDNDIRTLLKTWKQLLKSVKVVFYQGAAVHRGAVPSYFKDLEIPIEKLPFETAAKTGGIKHAYEELFKITCHGYLHQFFQDLQEGTLFKNGNSLDPTNCTFVSSVKGERRLEKQNYPSLNPDIKQRIHDAIQNDDYNGLLDIHDSQKNKDELVQYLSGIHSKLNEQTFLHYAVRDNLPGAVQALLDIGCDPQMKDKDGKVACELADKSIKLVFINFRLNNPFLYNWTKCHIPEPNVMNEEHSIKWRDDKEAQRRKVKEHRKMKQESKRVVTSCTVNV